MDPGCPPGWADLSRNGWFHPLQDIRRSWLGVLGEKNGFSNKNPESARDAVWWRKNLLGFPLPWSDAILLQRAPCCAGTWGLAISRLRRFPTSLCPRFLRDSGWLCAGTPRGSTGAGSGGLSPGLARVCGPSRRLPSARGHLARVSPPRRPPRGRTGNRHQQWRTSPRHLLPVLFPAL